MPAADYDLIIEQKATLQFDVQLVDSSSTLINLTGYDVRGRIVWEDASYLDLTVSNNRVTVTLATGTIGLYLPATLTATMLAQQGRWDLLLIAPVVAGESKVYKLLQGTAEVQGTLTP